MTYQRIIAISTLLLLQIPSAQATISKDFQRCASTALSNRGQNVDVISVNNTAVEKHEFNHDLSLRTFKYRMKVANKASGKQLGVVNCTISRSGDLLAATFEQ